MSGELKKLLELLQEQNSTLKRLINENQRLNSTYLNETAKENAEKLIKQTEEIKRIFEDAIKEVNKGLTNKIEVSSNGFENLKKNIEKTKKNIQSLEKQYQDLGKTIDELEKKDPVKHKKEIEDLKKLQDDVLDNYCKENDKLDEITDAYKKLDKFAIAYYGSANRAQKELNKQQLEGYNILDHYSEKWEQRTKAFRKGVGEIKKGITQIYEAASKALEPWAKANQEAMNYARTMGMSQKTADAYLRKTVSWASKNNIGILFNKSTDELIKMQGKYSDALGRNVHLTNEQKKDMLAMEKFLGEEGMVNIANNLENFGLGMSDSAEFVKKTMNEATKYGISANKLTKTIADNIKMAQNYTFKNGLEGLKSMAKKAIELKTDMSLVNGFLEKTSTVEGAISTGAKLQVLGGNYAMGSDPLSMMYESLNDMEGLFDRAVNMAKGKVFYDNKSGNFDMGAMDRYMMKQAATVMGIDPSKLIDVAFREASLGKIEEQVKLNSNISGDVEMMNLVKNLATWDKGNAVIDINGKATNVKDLTRADKEKLEAMQRTDSQNLQEMAINLRSLKEMEEGTKKEKQNEQADLLKNIGQGITNLMRDGTGMLNTLAKLGAWLSSINAGTLMLGGISYFTRGIYRVVSSGVGNIFDGSPRRGQGRGRGRLGKVTRGLSRAKNGYIKGSSITNSNIKAGIQRNGLRISDFKGGFKENQIQWKGQTYRDLGGGRLQNVKSGDFLGSKNATKALNNGTKVRGWSNASKVLGKSALKGLGRVGVAGGAIAGLTSIGADMMSGEFKKDVGGSIGRAAGATIGAVVGGIFGPVGSMIGGFLGSTVTGAVQDAQKKKRDKIRKEISAKLSDSMPQVANVFSGENAITGNYNKRQLRKLEAALSDGVLSESDGLSKSLLKKIKANGDFERMQQNGVQVNVAMGNGGLLEGKSHIQGGMPILGSNITVEGGEYVVNEKATKENLPLLESINNGKFKMSAKEPLGKQLKVKRGGFLSNFIEKTNEKIELAPISINLSGIIKLESNGKQVDISNDLLSNPTLISKLTEMISKELNILNNGSYNKGIFKQKFA